MLLLANKSDRRQDDRTPVKLASVSKLQKEGASKAELQMARLLAAHKAAMAYTQASERDNPEAQKFLGQDKV